MADTVPFRLLWPAVGFLAAFHVLPLLQTLTLAVTEPTFGFGNLHALVASPIYSRIAWNTVEIALTVATLCLLLGYPAALFIVERGPRAGAVLLLLVVVPFFTSLLVRNYAWIFLLGSQGVVNSLLRGAGLTERPLALMFNRFGVLVGMTHVLLPYTILTLVAVLRGIDPRLRNAGASLGSGPFGLFRRVVFPLARSGAAASFILVFVLALGFFVTPAMLGSPREMMIANVIASEMGFLRWGLAAALASALLVAALAAVALMQRAFGGLALIAPGLAGPATRGRRRIALPDRAAIALDRALDPLWRPATATVGAAVLAFLVLPILLIVPLSLTASEFFVFPPPGYSLRWYAAYVADPRWTGPTWNSAVIALATTALTLLLAIPAALAIARGRARWVGLAYLLILSPLIVPSIIIAISVFFLFSAVGLTQTMTGIVLGHTIGALPLAVVVLVAALGNFDWNLERAAMSLGSSRLHATLRIVIPVIASAVATAGFLAFLHSFDDLLIALFIGGIRLETLPRRMWESLQEINPTIAAVSTLLVLLVLALLAALSGLRAVLDRRLKRAG